MLAMIVVRNSASPCGLFAGAEVTLTRVLNTPSPDGPPARLDVSWLPAESADSIVGTSLSERLINTYPNTISSTPLVAKSSIQADAASFQAVLARGIPPSRIHVSA